LNNLRSPQQCHTRQPVDTDTPSLKVAFNSQNSDLWEAAIHEELESLREAQTWDEIEAPKGAKVFPSKFVLKAKRHSDGAVERYKARLVLLGNLQRPHIDFYDTYAPVADFADVRIMFVIACNQKWLIHQLDVKCAFLNGRIHAYARRLWSSRWTGMQAQKKHLRAAAGAARMEQATHARPSIRRVQPADQLQKRIP
jgi:Reverse transcriptase (RNA-dependent DNA polymerase)